MKISLIDIDESTPKNDLFTSRRLHNEHAKIYVKQI